MEKISKGLSGIAGEYFVAAELSRRGFMASITLRNTDSIDIHASNSNIDKLLAIQVKTQQGSVRSWPLSQKSETLVSPNLFYVFVSFRDILERPDYFIVPSSVVAAQTKATHSKWLSTPGKKGQPHNDNTMRMFEDKVEKFKEKWELLK
jgi:hypothetical protein